MDSEWGDSGTTRAFPPRFRAEWNVLNPAHQDFSKIEFEKPERFEFDASVGRGSLKQAIHHGYTVMITRW